MPVSGRQTMPIHRVKATSCGRSHPARVRIIEALQKGERSVGDLPRELGLDSSSASQHLLALRRQGLLDSQKEGRACTTRVKDPCTFQLLEVARQLLSAQLEETQALLAGLAVAPMASVAAAKARVS